MIKLLVAEDQVLIQKDICRKIEKTDKEVKIAGTALNGEEAYLKIKELEPDILITDIRMPLLNGLELIRRLKEENSNIKTVILSGYKDFEYAKAAIGLGVDEYLLKPVSIEDLRYVLDTLEEKIQSEQNYNFIHELYLLLNSGTPLSRQLNGSLDFSCYCLMLVNLNSCATFSFQDWLPYENELEELLKGPVVSKYLKKNECFHICNGNTYNQKILVFMLNKTPCEKLDMMASELQRQIQRLTSSVTICISRPMQLVDGLGTEYRLMSTQLDNQLIFAESSIFHSKDFLETNQQSAVLLNEEIQQSFLFCINSRNPAGLLSCLDKFLEDCHTQHITQKHLSSYLKSLLHLCFDSTDGKSLSNKELEIDEYLSNARTYEELKLSLHLLFEQLYHNKVLNQNPATNSEALVAEAKEYIRRNYAKDININEIAMHFSVTPVYLSRLFKKYSDVRPIEYLTSYRIQQACEYFSHSQLTVHEVADLCGYSNQYYFSKAFKQITSISPSEYRIQHQADGAE